MPAKNRTPKLDKTPTVAARPNRNEIILEGESPNILDDIRAMVTDPERWLDTPHINFVHRKPRDLIGTEDEYQIRELLRGIRLGNFS